MERNQNRGSPKLLQRGKLLTFCRAEWGVAAVEFAVLLPFLLLILVAAIEFGSVISSRIAVNASVSSVTKSVLLSGSDTYDAEYVLGAAGQIGSESGVDTVTVNFNQAYITIIENGEISNTEGSEADLCYCPIMQSSGMIWGPEVECNSECTDQTLAGRFMVIQVDYKPSILLGRFFEPDFLGRVSTVVRIR